MRKLLSEPAALLVVAGLAVAQAGCSQFGVLKGQMALRDAVKYYQRQDYKQAAAKYEEAIQANPGLGDAYFYLGNSYDNQYKPSRKGEPENDQLLQKAVENYKIAAMDSFKKARRYGKFRDGLPPKYFSRRIRKAFDTVAN